MGGGSLTRELLFHTGRRIVVTLASELVAVYALSVVYPFLLFGGESSGSGGHTHERLRNLRLGAFTPLAFKHFAGHEIKLYKHPLRGGSRQCGVEMVGVEFPERLVVNNAVLVER